jgi:hypothetical protein
VISGTIEPQASSVGERAVTPHAYCAMADECFKWVHDAQSVEQRTAYLKLGRAWLEAALVEFRFASSDNPEPEIP